MLGLANGGRDSNADGLNEGGLLGTIDGVVEGEAEGVKVVKMLELAGGEDASIKLGSFL